MIKREIIKDIKIKNLYLKTAKKFRKIKFSHFLNVEQQKI